jgi:hypothetical protein
MIKTYPLFYYDYRITAQSFYLNFDDGIGDISAQLRPGNYSPTKLANEVSRAMSTSGNQDYVCTFNRADRSFTITAALPFSLLITSGANAGLSAFGVLGFSGDDLAGLTSYTGNPAGKEYSPQFLPQDFIGFSDFKEFAEASINESASGEVEIYSIGQRSFMEFNITLATNLNQGRGGVIRSDSQGVEKLRDFLAYSITKGELEFMENETDRLNYSTIILESTASSSTGTGYKLNELYSRGLPEYFETGRLKWRLKEF